MKQKRTTFVTAIAALLIAAGCGATVEDSIAMSDASGEIGACPGTSEYGSQDSLGNVDFGVVSAPAPSKLAGEVPGSVPDKIVTASEMTNVLLDWTAVARSSKALPELEAPAGSMPVLVNQRILDHANSEEAAGSELLFVVGQYVGEDWRGVADVISLRPSGEAVFLAPCGVENTSAVQFVAKELQISPADVVRKRASDPVGFDRSIGSAPVTPPSTDWKTASPLSRQIHKDSTPPDVLAGLAGSRVTITVPEEWLADDGAICVATDVGVGECSRLSKGIGRTTALLAFANRDSQGKVRITFKADGDVPYQDLFATSAMTFPSSLDVELSGSRGAPEAKVSESQAFPEGAHPFPGTPTSSAVPVPPPDPSQVPPELVPDTKPR